MRTIVIGDVHGILNELRELFDALRVEPSDRVVFLGDLVDKGPEGPEVVRFVRENGYECILGNHEEMAIRWLKHDEAGKATGKKNPMKKGPDVYEEWLRLSPEDVAWLRHLPLTLYLGGNLIAAHAGFLPRVALADQHPNDIVRMRWVDLARNKMAPMEKSPDGLAVPPGCRTWTEIWDGVEGVVYGHVVHTLNVPRVDIRPGGPRSWCYGIDTGGVHGGRLTALVLKDDVSAPEVVQVDVPTVYVKFGAHGNGKDPLPVAE